MERKRVRFGEFEVPVPKGHKRISDMDETTEYLFIKAPKDVYTIYFDSEMPLYSGGILNGYEEGSTLELKMVDRRITFFCPSRHASHRDGLWYFNIEFSDGHETEYILPGQIVINSDAVFRKIIDGRLPFVGILEQIRLIFSTEHADPA